jgi:adenosine deaminase
MSAKISKEEVFRFPKADLHRHLDGSVRPEMVIRLAKQLGVKLPSYDPEEFAGLYCIHGRMSAAEIFKRFAWAIAVMRTPRGLEEAAYQAVVDAARENILYAEYRFAPGYHSFFPAPFYKPSAYEQKPFIMMTLDEAVEAAVCGLQRGAWDTGTIANLTLCIPRESIDQYGEGAAHEIAQLALRWQERGVVSLDLACDESKGRPIQHARAFLSTLGSSIRRNPHAGEMGGDRHWLLANIEACIELLKADGLGHAYPLHHSRSLMRKVQAKNIRIERHPLGAFAPHPADSGMEALFRRKIRLCIVSDDPVLYGQTLSDNLVAVLDAYGWGADELHQLVANSVNSAFYSSPQESIAVRELFVRRGLDKFLLND